MLTNVYQILSDDHVDYRQYGGVFLSIIHIAKVLMEDGVDSVQLQEHDLPADFKSTKKLLLDAVNLICCGKDEVTVSLIMDMEYNRQLLKQGVTVQELNELLIARVLIRLFMKHEYNTIHDIIHFLGDEIVCRALLADYPLIELNKSKEE